jgi:uncharacterized protein YbjT (DUF2867 family)
MRKTAVVFGATGLVGKTLTDLLLFNPDYEAVITPVRQEIPVKNDKLKQISFADYQEIQHFKNDLQADDYFCCVGTTIKKAGSQSAFQKVDHDFPVSIAKLAQELAVKNLVIISSVGADAKSTNFYLRTKGEMEKSVRSIYTGNLKFVRPSLIMGDRNEKRVAEKFGVVLMSLLGWMFVGGLKKYKGIEVKNLAHAMIRATTLPADKTILEYSDLKVPF